MATFDKAALSKLTAKLDNKLAGAKLAPPVKKPELKNTKGKRKLDQATDIRQPPAKKRNQQAQPKLDKSSNGKPSGKPNAKPSAKPNAQSRDRDRQAKPQDKNPQDKKSQDKKQKVSQPIDLLDEIKALGGDEDDYKLIENIDSDDDTVNEPKVNKDADKALQAELARFAAGLGFDQVQPDPVSEESDASEDDDVNGGASGDDDEGVEQDEEAASDNQAEGAPTQDPKWKTVSKPL
jgi:ribosome biogenesis protein MAK21